MSGPCELVHELCERLTWHVGNGQIAGIFVFEVLACGADTRKSAQSREHRALVPEPRAAIAPELIHGAMRPGLLQHAGRGCSNVTKIDRAQHTAGRSGAQLLLLLLVDRGQQRGVHLADCLALGFGHAPPDGRRLPGGLFTDAPGCRVNAPIERLHTGRGSGRHERSSVTNAKSWSFAGSKLSVG
jgi:hypothetical protein